MIPRIGMTPHWAALVGAGCLLSGSLPACHHDSRVEFASNATSSAVVSDSVPVVMLAELEKGDDLKIEFEDGARHFVTLDLQRIEAPWLIGTVGRYDAESDDWVFEPGRIDWREAKSVLRREHFPHIDARDDRALGLLTPMRAREPSLEQRCKFPASGAY